jgi:cyclase
MPAIRWRSPVATTNRAPTNSPFLDITASSDNRDLILHIIEHVAAQVFIPLTVGGGVRAVDDVRRLLHAGADKVSINTAAVFNPQLVKDCTDRFGISASWWPSTPSRRSGARRTAEMGNLHPRRAQAHRPRRRGMGAQDGGTRRGEILLTSMDRDGAKIGFDLNLTRAIVDAVNIPGHRQSGGVGNLRHHGRRREDRRADAVLAASIFHFGEYTVEQPSTSYAGARHRGKTCEREDGPGTAGRST